MLCLCKSDITFDSNTVIIRTVRNRKRESVADYRNAGSTDLWILSRTAASWNFSQIKWEGPNGRALARLSLAMEIELPHSSLELQRPVDDTGRYLTI